MAATPLPSRLVRLRVWFDGDTEKAGDVSSDRLVMQDWATAYIIVQLVVYGPSLNCKKLTESLAVGDAPAFAQGALPLTDIYGNEKPQTKPAKAGQCVVSGAVAIRADYQFLFVKPVVTPTL